MKKIKLAVVGVGNCASSLIQGIEYYKNHHNEHSDGIMQPQINGWRPQDIEIVAAFDVDKRKIGLPIAKAIFAEPNCTTVFQKLIPVNGVRVKMGPLLDGMADHMKEYPETQSFRVAEVKPVNIVEELKNSGKDPKIVDKIALGKLNKFVNENTLLNQEWIIEPKKSVKEVLKKAAGNDKIEIKKFISYCKSFENKDGYLSQAFFKKMIIKKAQFISGPFANVIFEIIKKQKNKLKIIVGNVVTTISDNSDYLYRPI